MDDSVQRPGCPVRSARRLAFTGVVLATWVAISLGAQPSSLPREDFWVPDGQVRAIVETNGVVYIGGEFDYVGLISETGRASDLIAGTDYLDFPKFKGAIKAVVTDNQGGWFVGGLFTAVGGKPVTNLAHILADRTLDTNWNPNPNGTVLSLAVGAEMVYAGGTFSRIGGQALVNLAAVDLNTGAARSWRADATSLGVPSVNALVLAGGVLYIGGYFSTVNGILREHIAAVDAGSGAVTSWFPSGYTGSQAGSRVDALAISDNTLFVGGTFTSIGGQQTNGPNRNYIAALDVTKTNLNSVLLWNPDANGPVNSIAVSCDTIYLGGAFTAVGGSNRNHLAAVDITTGKPSAWNPNANDDVLKLLLTGKTIYAGGKFNRVGGQNRDFLAALDVDSGQATLWNPKADTGVSAMALAQNTLLSGGALGPGGKVRKNVAALDVRTGRPLENWKPEVDGHTTNSGSPYGGVYAMTISGNSLYLGGAFTNIDGELRNRLGAVELASGAQTNWNANAGGIVYAIAAGGGRVFAGGAFANAGGLTRSNLASFDPLTGTALATWRADTDSSVVSLDFEGANLYAGGQFKTIGNANRKKIAGIDASTAAVLPWNPDASDLVSTISILGNNVYLGGQFGRIGTQAVTRIGAVDITTGNVSCWRPSPQAAGFAGVNAIVASSSGVYAGGTFSTIGGQPRNNLASLSNSCPGNATSWNPSLDKPVSALAAASTMIFAGGQFQTVGGQYHPFFAVFPPEGTPRITLQPLSYQAGIGADVALAAQAAGQGPLSFQWQLNGTNVPGATSSNLFLSNVQNNNSGDYVVVVTNAIGRVESKPATLTVIQPLVITAQPASQTVSPGATVTLIVGAVGNPPPLYQWRLNGVNIPGAIYSTFTIANAQPVNGGSYEVVVANFAGAINSHIAVVRVTSPPLALSDNLASRTILNSGSQLGSSDNRSATWPEAGEPNHAGKIGGKSVWLGWRAPASGIATFSTRGSDFDTLLAVYTNAANLTRIAADEDRGGFLTSQTAFNAVAGIEYLIAVDGFAGASGNIVLGWNLDTTTAPFPRILNEPVSATVTNGATAAFSVDVNSSSTVAYQWFHECLAIPGATGPSLVITNIRSTDVGRYYVQIVNASSYAAQSHDAFLEIGPQRDVLSQDKLEDVFAGSAPASAGFALAAAASGSVLSPSLGTVNSQLINNSTATTSLTETNHCGVLGGASKWLGVRPAANGIMQIDTIGSAIDTILAVYSGTSLLNIREVVCDNNGAPDRIRSLLKFDAQRGVDYLLAVDGVGGAKGAISLNWKFGLPPTVTPAFTNIVVPAGSSTELSISAFSHTRDLAYQWRLNGVAIKGETNSILRIPDVQAAQVGTYTVVVRNFAGALTVQVAVVRIGSPIQIGYAFDGAAFVVTGPSSRGYMIEASTNLLSWSPVYTNSSATASPINWTDRQSPQFRTRMYRLVPF